MNTLTQLFLGTLAVAAVASCSTEPEPIVFGADVCHFCKMTIVDDNFGAELVTKKGKVYKFDDVKCLLDYYNSEYESQDIFEHRLVIDFAGSGNLIDATSALYITSPGIRSPMNGQTAAFQSKPVMEDHNKEWNGTYLTWGELTARFN